MAAKVVQTLSDCHQLLSDYIGEDNPPSTTDSEYSRRTRWLNNGREDQASAYFFTFLLTSTIVNIIKGSSSPVVLPSDFQSANSLKQFKTVLGKIDYTDPYEPNGNYLIISRDFSTELYQVTLNPVSAVTDTANVFYYSTPPPMVNSTDLVIVDGALAVMYALMQYHFKNENWTQFQQLQQLYDKTMQDNIRLDAINANGAQTQMQNTEIAQHAQDQRQFYSGNTRKNF
jgi:predicted N-acyltransferase